MHEALECLVVHLVVQELLGLLVGWLIHIIYKGEITPAKEVKHN